MISTGWYYMTTDRWRYDGAPASYRAISPRNLDGKQLVDNCKVRPSAAGCLPAYRRSPRVRPSWVR